MSLRIHEKHDNNKDGSSQLTCYLDQGDFLFRNMEADWLLKQHLSANNVISLEKNTNNQWVDQVTKTVISARRSMLVTQTQCQMKARNLSFPALAIIKRLQIHYKCYRLTVVLQSTSHMYVLYYNVCVTECALYTCTQQFATWLIKNMLNQILFKTCVTTWQYLHILIYCGQNNQYSRYYIILYCIYKYHRSLNISLS